MPMVADLTLGLPLRASPLGALTCAFTGLAPGGRLTLCVASNDLVDSPDLARCSAYVCSIAQRCGFEPGTIPGADALCPKDGVPLGFERMPRPPRWRLTHLTPDALDAFCALFQVVFGHTMAPPSGTGSTATTAVARWPPTVTVGSLPIMVVAAGWWPFSVAWRRRCRSAMRWWTRPSAR